MGCRKGRDNPTPHTKLRLFADSGGYCQRPGCASPLFRDIEDTSIHIAEMAHIISASDDGPRANDRLDDIARARYENLILLCPTCHTIIDKAEDKYSEDTVTGWKEDHRTRIANLFGIKTFNRRVDARNFIAPILEENRTIFEQYGPMSDERFNPESSMPTLWLRKVLTRLIPNNRRILSACDANRELLAESEQRTVELLRQHVDDFEAKHIGESPSHGAQFPKAMGSLFSEALKQ